MSPVMPVLTINKVENIDYLFEESKDHDLVRAIYKDCEYKDNFKGIENLKKYDQYPRQNGRF